ncbi:MAG: response regulator [Chloroflexaceae bacterium]|nr:response regulator [Chloroflexaceae bacterium]
MAATRILIAEDNDLVSLTLEEQLKDLGYDVVGIARTGTEAVALAQRLSPDLVIMDIRMPEMDGTEAASKIRAARPVPIIMLTAYADKDTIRRAEQAGALGYLVKPINENELPPAINIALARFKEMQALQSQVDELQESLEARKLIERAKGILMQRLGLTERDAYERLRQRARDKRIKMKEIAQAIMRPKNCLAHRRGERKACLRGRVERSRGNGSPPTAASLSRCP